MEILLKGGITMISTALMLAWLGWIGVVGFVVNALMLQLQRTVARRMGAVQ